MCLLPENRPVSALYSDHHGRDAWQKLPACSEVATSVVGNNQLLMTFEQMVCNDYGSFQYPESNHLLGGKAFQRLVDVAV